MPCSCPVSPMRKHRGEAVHAPVDVSRDGHRETRLIRCDNRSMTIPPDRPRDMVGYGAHPPDPKWPGEARIAVQFVLNYEEGGESNVLYGDPASETFLS